MIVDKDGIVYEHTYVSEDGSVIVHHHGTKALTPEQNDYYSEIISRIWDKLPSDVKREINRKIELKYENTKECQNVKRTTVLQR